MWQIELFKLNDNVHFLRRCIIFALMNVIFISLKNINPKLLYTDGYFILVYCKLPNITLGECIQIISLQCIKSKGTNKKDKAREYQTSIQLVDEHKTEYIHYVKMTQWHTSNQKQWRIRGLLFSIKNMHFPKHNKIKQIKRDIKILTNPKQHPYTNIVTFVSRKV